MPGRDKVGDIDVGGLQFRWGPQTSSNLRLVQNVFAGEYQATQTRGAHLVKIGGLVEHYQDNMVNPTFSLGIYTFPSLSAFLQARPTRFIGLTPDAALDRYWRFTLFSAYVQDEWRLTDRLTLSGGLRYEDSTMPEDIYGRDVSLPNLSDTVPTPGPLYQRPRGSLSPRVGAAWDAFGDGRTSVRGGYGLYTNTNNHQNLIVTVTNPPATPRPVIANPTFPTPSFGQLGTLSIRPMQWDIDNPTLHVYNVSVQREAGWDTVFTLGVAGSRGVHLWRSYDANVPTPTTLADGTPFFAATAARPNPAFSTIELKASDGDSWYNALILEGRKRLSGGLSLQSSYTWGKNIDTTQASTFFSDSTTGTTTAFPESLGPDYNRGLADFHVKHTWVVNFTWALPFARGLDEGLVKHVLDGWQLVGIGQLRSGPPLTPFVANNWSRSRWSPSLGPGTGFDRPELCPWSQRRRRDSRDARAVVRSHRLRAAAAGHARQRRARLAHRSQPARGRLGPHQERAMGPAGLRGASRSAAGGVQHLQPDQLRSARAHCLQRIGGQRRAAGDVRAHPVHRHRLAPDPARCKAGVLGGKPVPRCQVPRCPGCTVPACECQGASAKVRCHGAMSASTERFDALRVCSPPHAGR